MKYLAIDYGLKRTGLAVCDQSETICSPLAVLQTSDDLIGHIAQVIHEQQVQAVVIGLPLNMDDSEGPQAKTARRFAESFKAQLDLPIYFQDERLTSYAAEDKLQQAELTRKKKKKRLDAVAAAQILETFLENKPD